MPAPASERWQTIDSLFERALDLDAEERHAFLRTACDDDTVRAEVEALLDSIEASVARFADGASAFVPDWSEAIERDKAPLENTRLGPWHVEREVGRGGMGTVYRAARADGLFERTAAVKVLRRGLDTDDLLARFRAERRILARLQHPGVAALLDGGATDDGRPYLVMEFVEGEPITAYCDARRLSVDDRLRLFRQVCEAVAYAHRHLVVHRDLKPSNVLVAEDDDGRDRVKLLDFGIAKLLDAESDDGALTRTGHALLTPDYAAPEQLRGEAPTTATDVYALGVLLYQLLTGRRPYERPGDAPDTRPEPAAPSAAAGRVGEAVAEQRGTQPDGLRRRLRGDLDGILLKALHAEPEQRYASAEALAADLERHLTGLPVEARPPTLGYRLGTFARRHRLGIGVTGLIALTLFIGLGIALRQAERARTEAARTERAHAFLLELFRPLDPYGEALSADVSMREFLAIAVERIVEEAADEPALRYELLGDFEEIYKRLGESENMHRVAILNDSLTRADFPHDGRERVAAVCRLGWGYFVVGAPERAEPMLRECITEQARFYGESSSEAASAYHNLGYFLRHQGRFGEADTLARRAVALYRKADDAEGLAIALQHHALALVEVGKAHEALASAREALDLVLRLHEETPSDATVAFALTNAATALNAVDQHAEAERHLLRAERLLVGVFGAEHSVVLNVRNKRARAAWALGRRSDAERLLRDGLATYERRHGAASMEAGGAFLSLGIFAHQEGRLGEAAPLLHQSLTVLRSASSEATFRTADPLLALADLALDMGAYETAEERAREAAALLPAEHWRAARAHGLIGRALAGQGRTEEARALLTDACERIRAVPSGDERMRETCDALAAIQPGR